LGVSDFLWDDFIRMQYQNLFPVIKETDTLSIPKGTEQYQQELAEILKTKHKGAEKPEIDSAWKIALNEFKDREMFRIDMRHILGFTEEFWDFSEELTCLTDVIVNSALHLTSEDLRSVHGTPRLADGSIAHITALALGKCGGRELGFASDIELLFIYSGEGQTDGTEPIMNSLFFEKVVQHFLNAIKAKQEGIFQVDLRLRPYGNSGSMAVSLAAFEKYYSPKGPAWPYERQALVKMRRIAGDESLGEKVCKLRDDYVYNGDAFDVISMRAMREKQVRHLVSAGKFNAKYSPGGLVDIEYLVQGLQINLGRNDPSLRLNNIRAEMKSLFEKGFLTLEDYTKLHKAHTFLRWLIDSMRVVRGNSKDVTVPAFGTEEFLFLSRRLKFGNDTEKLQETISQVQSDVVDMNHRLLQ
jgi:glutamate-ammonia-ligase adenylyltransferase